MAGGFAVSVKLVDLVSSPLGLSRADGPLY